MKNVLVVGSMNMDLSIEVERMPQIGETLVGRNFTVAPGGKGANQRHSSKSAWCGGVYSVSVWNRVMKMAYAIAYAISISFFSLCDSSRRCCQNRPPVRLRLRYSRKREGFRPA